MSAGAAVLLLALLGANTPYVRTRADTSDPESHCFWWPGGATITYHQSEAGNPVNAGAEFPAVARSWESWQQVMDSCGSLKLVEGARTASRTIGYDQTEGAVNENIVLFRQVRCEDVAPSSDPCWAPKNFHCQNKYDCWGYSSSVIALTTSTYDANRGKLYDSDVELNSTRYYFTAVDGPPCGAPPYTQSCVAYDIQNTMTHEIGHVLGLDHTAYLGSTMNATAPIGETSKRVVDPGSRSFVCDVYPPGSSSVDCVTPKSCGCATDGVSSGLLGLLATLGSLLRRRARRGVS